MTRARVYSLMSPAEPGDGASLAVDRFIIALILLSVLLIVLESVDSVREIAPTFFDASEWLIVGVFTIEYALRIWSCTADQRHARPISGRLRFALRPDLLIDLAAILPAFLPMFGFDLRVLRMFRALRLLRVLKLGRYSRALGMIGSVLRKRREELLVTVGFVAALLLIASCLMYYAEHDAQPETFVSIPAAMWWAVVTLTTVGYGDMYPITPMGKIIAAVMSVLAIGLVALPTGILGAGFVEEMEASRAERPEPPADHAP